MQIASRGPDILCHVGGESDHVMLHLPLDLENALHRESAFLADGASRALWDKTGLSLDLGGSDLHLQPGLKLVFVAPDAAHFRACITRNHEDPRFAVSDLRFSWGTAQGERLLLLAVRQVTTERPSSAPTGSPDVNPASS